MLFILLIGNRWAHEILGDNSLMKRQYKRLDVDEGIVVQPYIVFSIRNCLRISSTRQNNSPTNSCSWALEEINTHSYRIAPRNIEFVEGIIGGGHTKSADRSPKQSLTKKMTAGSNV